MKSLMRYFATFFNSLIEPNFVVYNGIRLKIDKKVVSKHIRKLIYSYRYEAEEVKKLICIIDETDVIMELGAGIGFLSITCAKRKNKVVSYEANPSLVKLIEENARLNDTSIIVKNAILSDKKGEAEFYIEDNFYSSSTIQRSNRAKKIAVPTESVNEEISKYEPTMLIIDIEGGEIDLINQIYFSENKVRKILIELHPHIVGHERISLLVKQLLACNFILDVKLSGNYVFYFYRTENNLKVLS